MFSRLSRPQVRRAFTLTIIVLLAVAALPFIHTQAASSIKVQIDKGGGTDNTQETAFNFLVKNTGTAAVSGISARIYFTPDGSNAASGYVLEKYYDQSGAATISGPTLLSGSTYYFTVNYGTASLAAGGQWEFQTALHLSSWASTYSGANDYYHTGYAVGALPAAYTDTNYITAYVSGTLAWGTEPGSGTATNTFVPPTTAVPTTPSGSLPDLVVTSITSAPPSVPCGTGWNPGINVTVANNGTGAAGTFVVSLSNSGGTALTMTVSGLAAGQSITVRFNQNGGQVTATADSTNVVTESNETNNSLSGFVPVSDPLMCTFTPTPPTPTGSADLTIKGTVTRTDYTCASSGVSVVSGASIYVSYNGAAATLVGGTDGNGNYNIDLGNVAVGTKVTVSTTGATSSSQTFTHNAAETVTINLNIVSPTVTPCPATPTFTPTITQTPGTPTNTPTNPLPDLVVTNIWFGPQPTPCQASQGLYVTVANNGNADAGSFVVRIGTTSALDQTVSGLAAGQSIKIAFLNAPQYGSVTATADATNLVTESNETNNSLTTTLPVLTPPVACTNTPTPTITPTPGSNILVTGTITDACGNGVGIKGVQMWIGLLTGTLKPAGNVSDGNGNYSISFAVTGVTNIDGKAVVVLPHANGWTFTPNYSTWVHPAGTVENKTINFTATTAGSGGCSATPTNTVTPLTTPTVGPTGGPRTTPLTLEGFVYDASSLTPISGAAVSDNDTCTPHAALNAFVDSSGFYILQVPGNYACGAVTAWASGYTTFNDPSNVTQLYANGVTSYFLTRGSPTPSTPATKTNTPTLTVTPSPTLRPDPTITLYTYFVQGHVTLWQACSAPVANVTVQLTEFDGTIKTRVTDTTGFYQIQTDAMSPTQTFSVTVTGTSTYPSPNSYTFTAPNIDGAFLTADFALYPNPQITNTPPGVTFTPSPTGTACPSPTFTPTPGTPVVTATKTNTPTLTATLTPSKSSTPNASDPCASPTVITGGGSFNVTTATTCFKYVNTSFVNGGMFSIMKDSTSASDTLKWYGGMDQNATSCTNQSSTVSGNGGQLNNFTVAKDANGQMFLIVTGSAANSITISIQNWQNGTGCSVKPTVHP